MLVLYSGIKIDIAQTRRTLKLKTSSPEVLESKPEPLISCQLHVFELNPKFHSAIVLLTHEKA
jgi:hypothetical protein